MRKPHIYIHRAGDWYGLYMNAENEQALRAFADVTSDGTRTEPVPPDAMIAQLRDVDGILSLNGLGSQEITTAVLQAVETVRVVSVSHWWHTNHNPARAMWQAAGVEVIDASAPCTEAVVEWVVGTAIMALRRLREFDRALKTGSAWAEPGRRDAILVGEAVIGLIGVGRIGRIVARHFRMFGATVIAYDPFLTEDDAGALGIQKVSLEEALRTADVLSMHMAVTDVTRKMLGAREFGWIKDGAIFLNSARSALLDSDALVAELRTNRFRAYLDVYDTEPLPLDDPLRTLDNVSLTPHIAGDTTGMFLRCGANAIACLRDYFARHPVA